MYKLFYGVVENKKWGHLSQVLCRYLFCISSYFFFFLVTPWSSNSVWIKWDCPQDCVTNLALSRVIPNTLQHPDLAISNLLMMSLWRLLLVRSFFPLNANAIKTLSAFDSLKILFLFMYLCMRKHTWVQEHAGNRRGLYVPGAGNRGPGKSSKCSSNRWVIFSILPILQLFRPLTLNSTHQQNNECLCFCKQIIITWSISGCLSLRVRPLQSKLPSTLSK